MHTRPAAYITPTFRVRSSAYAGALARAVLWKWLWLAILIPFATGIAAFHDIRYAYVTLICVFVVYPMVLSIAWFTLVGRPSFTLLTRPQRWIFGLTSESSVQIEFFSFDIENEEDQKPCETICFNTSDIETLEFSSDKTFIRLKKATAHKISLLIIPSTNIPTAKTFPSLYRI